MDIYDIAKSRTKKLVFNEVLEEACRQLCSFIDDAPERKDGEGFAEFFYEIFSEKEKEYVEQLGDGKASHRMPKHKELER